MRITIKASDVAACVGLNKFKTPEEVRDDLWKKHSPETFKGKTKLDEAREILSKSKTAQDAMARAVSVKTNQSSDTDAIMKMAEAVIKSDTVLSEEDKVKALEHIRSKVATSHGTRSEDKTADKVVTEEGVTLIRDNNFHKIEICEMDGVNYSIVGKIDRIELAADGTRTLVEIKNRTKKLFRQVYPSENVQIQTYLQMLNLDQAKLIEQYNSETCTMRVPRDQELWDEDILPLLESFCKELHQDFAIDAKERVKKLTE